jgi:uncharacterized membrane protein YkoI
MNGKHVSGWAVAALLMGLSGPAWSAAAQETQIKLGQVPKAVMDSARAKFPGALFRGASKETEDGKTVYELEMTREDRRMDVTFREDGTLVLVETVVPEKEVPSAVLRGVKERYPGAKIDLVESVKRGPAVKKEVDYYEFHLTTADKKSAEVEVNPGGKILKTEEKPGKDEDDNKR